MGRIYKSEIVSVLESHLKIDDSMVDSLADCPEAVRVGGIDECAQAIIELITDSRPLFSEPGEWVRFGDDKATNVAPKDQPANSYEDV